MKLDQFLLRRWLIISINKDSAPRNLMALPSLKWQFGNKCEMCSQKPF